jgi:hypothetical protein
MATLTEIQWNTSGKVFLPLEFVRTCTLVETILLNNVVLVWCLYYNTNCFPTRTVLRFEFECIADAIRLVGDDHIETNSHHLRHLARRSKFEILISLVNL